MTDSPENPAGAGESRTEAAAWVLRRDRGFSPREQDQFSQWLAADPRHGEQFAFHQHSWERLDQLAQWRPGHSAKPNPDLLALPRRRPAMILGLAAGLAAAAILASSLWWTRAPAPAVLQVAAIDRGVGQRVLDDGSVLELNRGAVVEVQFTPEERRVRLVRGEVHFAVAKNPRRPFVVRAGGVAIRAVGTKFDVRLADESVDVLVTEGRVQVNPPAVPAGSRAMPLLTAGQRVVISLAGGSVSTEIAPVSAEEEERLLAWQTRLLDFTATPLSEIVADFNRHNSVQLIVADPELGALQISASFRSDNVDGFVRLLEASFGVRAERRGEVIVLRRKS